MTTTNDLQLPRPNTGARAVIDQLRQRPLTYSDAVGIYRIARRNLSGVYPSLSHVGLTLTRILKKYGYKGGKPGSRAPWHFRPQSVSGIISGVPLPDIDTDLDEGTEVADFVSDRFSLPEDEAPKTKTYEVASYKVDGLVKYSGPLEQDRNILGRIMGVDLMAETCDVMWATTTEREYNVPMEDLTVYKDSISRKSSGSDDVGGAYTRQIVPGFEIGDEVTYDGSEYGIKGKRGKVVGIYRSRRQVQWEGNHGQSSEILADLKAVPKAPEPEPLKVGQYVECKKDRLTFPAKVLLGPMSNGLYKVVCPNGTFEWVGRDQMTPKEEREVYQATPEKPQYEGQPEESERTRSLRAQLAASQHRDQLTHWARLAVRAMSPEQKDVLLEVLKQEV